MNRDAAHLAYILESIPLILELAAKEGRARYDEDWVIRSAILQRLQTMSESVTKLSEEVKQRFPEIPWHKIRTFRNALAHGYLAEIDDNLVWQVIQDELKPLQQILQPYFEETYGRQL